MSTIELKHREGEVIDCTGIPADFLRTLKDKGALAKGWAFEATIKADPFADDAPAVETPAPKPRKPRTPKADATVAPVKERKPRASKEPDGESIKEVRAFVAANPASTAEKIAKGTGIASATVKAVLAWLKEAGQVTVGGAARGTHYTIAAVQS